MLLQSLGWVPLWGAPMAEHWDAFALHLVGKEQRFPEWQAGILAEEGEAGVQRAHECCNHQTIR